MGLNIYIQSRETGKFWRQTGAWVDSPAEAQPFDSATKAYDFTLQQRINNAEIVFQKHAKVESVLRDLARG